MKVRALRVGKKGQGADRAFVSYPVAGHGEGSVLAGRPWPRPTLQGSLDIVQAAHTTIVVSAPGLGDDIQAIKAGILEIADIHVVSKCDRPDANRTITDLKGMMSLGLSLSGATNWPVPVIATSALKLEGVSELLKAIDQHWEYLGTSGELDKQKKRIAERRMLNPA